MTLKIGSNALTSLRRKSVLDELKKVIHFDILKRNPACLRSNSQAKLHEKVNWF
jgi:hypothetical protein